MSFLEQRSKPYQIDCQGNMKQIIYANAEGNLLQQIYQMHKIDNKINDNQAYNLKGHVIEQTERIKEIQQKFLKSKNLRILYQELFQLSQEKNMDILVKTSTLEITDLDTQQNTYTFKTSQSTSNKMVQFSTDCFKDSPMELNDHFEQNPSNNDINEYRENIEFIDSENETSQSSPSNHSFQIESLQCINNNNNQQESRFNILNKLNSQDSKELTPHADYKYYQFQQSTKEETQENTEIMKRDYEQQQQFKKQQSQSESTISNVSNCGSQHRLEDSELDQYDYHFNDSVDLQISLQDRKISNFKQQIQEKNTKKSSLFRKSIDVKNSIKTAEPSESCSVSPEARSRTVSTIVGGGRQRRMSLNVKNLSVNINNSNFKRKNSTQIVLLKKSGSEELQQQ